MNVRVFSDLHLEFMENPGDFEVGSGDILVLAGDICVAAEYDKVHTFFEKCVENYNRVLYVLGNHEHYNGDFNDTYWTLQAKLPKGVTLMNNKSVLIDGVHFVGATLWTNMNNLNADTMAEAGACMNDYHLVENFSPEQSVEQHLFTRQWFESCIPMLRGPVFMITHHAPSPQSVKGRYTETTPMYSSDMEDFISKHPNIRYWAHGHIHHSNDYQVGECRVIANPRGYDKVEVNSTFDPKFSVNINP